MFEYKKELAYTVRVEKPNPAFARMLQQAIGGVEGELRVMTQYLFQAWGSRGPARYKDMLLNTGTEEIGHVEMLATAVAMNLEGAPTSVSDDLASDPVIAARLGGMDVRHLLSAGLTATPTDANGNPFNGGYVIGTGNLMANMYANVHAEASGRLLAARLWEATDDPGMKDMLSFLIARDAMHQNQWMAVIEEHGASLPVPAEFPTDREAHEFSYVFFQQGDADVPADARWTSGPSIDGRGEFELAKPSGYGGPLPDLPPAPPETWNGIEAIEPTGGLLGRAAAKARDAVKGD